MTDTAQPAPPVARKQPVERRHHGDLFIDDYEWLRDKESPEVLAHLEAENAYTDAVTADQAPLREAIFAEIKGRTKEADLSVPRREGQWWYYSRTVEGGQHPIFCRVRAATTGDERADWTPPRLPDDGGPLPGEQVLLDANADSQRHDFYALGGFDIAHDGSLLAWLTDTTGDERFALHVRDLTTGADLVDEITGLGYGVEFLPGDREVMYTVVDDSWRPHEIRIHRIGDDPARDRVVFREDDPEMWLDATISDDRRFIVISVGNSELSEVHPLPLMSGTGLPLSDRILVLPRRARTLYDVVPIVAQGRSKLAILHHDGARNGELVLVDAGHSRLVGSTAERIADLDPEVVIAASETERLLDVAHAGRHLVIESMRDGLPTVSVRPLDDLATELRPAIDEELVAVSSIDQEWGAPVLRLEADSWVRPTRILEVHLDDLAAGAAPVLRRETPVLGGYDPGDYRAERHWATARDGVRVP
ncbi:MAG: S9 family peptidase, partial [Microbacteriaceae bacterium]|nr:S9 family peptidase [Microbacteriaceae bacterium]